MQDLNDFGLNRATVSTLGCIFTTLLGTYGQLDQIRKIWKAKDAEKVSGLMSVVLLTLFAAYLVRGVAEERIVFRVQGFLRVPTTLLIVIGVICYGNCTKSTLAWLFIGLGVLIAMSVLEPWRLLIFSLVLCAGVIGAGHQAWNVRHKNGRVSFVSQTLSLASVSFQSWYAWHYDDMALLIPCLLFMVAYTTTLILMVKNRRK